MQTKGQTLAEMPERQEKKRKSKTKNDKTE